MTNKHQKLADNIINKTNVRISASEAQQLLKALNFKVSKEKEPKGRIRSVGDGDNYRYHEGQEDMLQLFVPNNGILPVSVFDGLRRVVKSVMEKEPHILDRFNNPEMVEHYALLDLPRESFRR